MANELFEFDFLPLSIRIETLGGVATPLVLRGTPLPAKRSDTYSTAIDDQSSVEVSLFLGERPLIVNNIEIGKFRLEGIPPAKRGLPKIQVEFSVDKKCIVTARATLEGAQISAKQQFRSPVELTRDFIAKALAEAEANRKRDQVMLQRIESVNNARQLLAEAEKHLQQSPDRSLSEKIAALGLALDSGDYEEIRKQSEVIKSNLILPDLFSGFDFSQLWTAPQRQSQKTVRKTSESPKKPPVTKQALTTKSTHTLGKIFGSGEFTLDPLLCFVLMPFAEEFKMVYEDHVKPIVEKVGLRCERADEILGTTIITRDIWERVNRARFLVAELTGQNANVFYELGLAHAIGKDVILLSRSMDFVPFDLKTNRIIVYDYTPRGVKALEDKLEKTIDAILKSA